MADRETEDGELRATKLPAERSSVPAARAFAVEASRQLGGSPSAEEQLQLLVSELATNAIIHAGTPLRLTVSRNGPHLRIELRDDDPTPPADPLPQDPLAPGGRGMYLVDAIATDWGVNRNERGKTVWFELDENPNLP